MAKANAPNPTILVVDDEPDIREMIQFTLERNGYKVFSAANGPDALAMLEDCAPDLIILDVMMPGMDGHQVCYRLKADPKTKFIPVIMLTARSEETDEVIGFSVGTDDYVKKPFSPRVLAARVAAMLRRNEETDAAADTDDTLKRGPITIRQNRHQVLLDGEEIRLTPIEYNILLFLCKRPGWVYTRERIISEVQGDDVIITERTVDVHVVSVRKKLGDHADYIQTVRGVGYKLKE